VYVSTTLYYVYKHIVMLPLKYYASLDTCRNWEWHGMWNFRRANIHALWDETPCGLVVVLMYLLTAILFKAGGSSTVHIYTQQYTE